MRIGRYLDQAYIIFVGVVNLYIVSAYISVWQLDSTQKYIPLCDDFSRSFSDTNYVYKLCYK